MSKNPYRGDVGMAPFARNTLEDHVLVGMSKTQLRQRRRTRVDTARQQRIAIRLARRMMKADVSFKELVEKAQQAAWGQRTMGDALDDLNKAASRALRKMRRR